MPESFMLRCSCLRVLRVEILTNGSLNVTCRVLYLYLSRSSHTNKAGTWCAAAYENAQAKHD